VRSRGYELLGFVVWRAAMRSIRQDARGARDRLPNRRVIAATAVLGAAAIAAVVALKRGRSSDPGV
jgi:hypothetical protein